MAVELPPLVFFKTKLQILLVCLLCSLPQLGLALEKPVIRFGVLSIAQPSRIFAKWQPFADYMAQQLQQPVEIVVPRGFGKMKQAIASGKVDFFYINSHVFYRLKQKGKVVAVAQMKNINGQTTSRSEVFVKRDSNINNTGDLKGKNIAYVSPMGAGGYLAPRAFLYKAGLQGGIDNKESFTKNLSNSIHGVLLGDYDAAAMCGVNYKLMSRKIETGELRIIVASDPYPENLLAARVNLSLDIIERFRHVVLNMSSQPSGLKLLESMYSMKIKSFVKYDDKLEQLTKKLLEEGHI